MPYTLEQCGRLRRSELDDLHKGDVWEHPNGLLYILYPNNEELKTVYAPIPRLRKLEANLPLDTYVRVRAPFAPSASKCSAATETFTS